MSYTYGASRRPNNSKSQEVLSVILHYVLPFFAINGLIFYLVVSKPQLKVTVGENSDYSSVSVDIRIQSILPTKNLKVTMDSMDVELVKNSKRSYTATLKKNGALEVSVENFNGMSQKVIEQISSLDDNPPSVLSSLVEGGTWTLVLNDSQSGIDFDSIYAVNAEGQRLLPQVLEKETGTVSFQIEKGCTTVYVKDFAGHETQTAYTWDSAADKTQKK